MPAKLAKHRASWLQRELAQVKRLLREGVAVRAIGKLLGRTEGAIRKKLHDEGISARRSKPNTGGKAKPRATKARKKRAARR